MTGESEAFQRRLIRFFRTLLPELFGNGMNHSSNQGVGRDGVQAPISIQPGGDSSAAINSGASEYRDSHTSSFLRENLVELGEIPAVQDRFHALLKHRLQTEIERNPPLFPWETEIHDYEAETSSYGTVDFPPVPQAVPASAGSGLSVGLWRDHLRQLNLPIAVPEPVLAQLMQRCQELLRLPLLEGARLVRAVEALFPGQDDALNYLAGLVMTAPVRSGETAMSPVGSEPALDYETALPVQQMVLSLMAAKELLGVLTVRLSEQQPVADRQWLTEAGPLTLRAGYTTDEFGRQLRIQAMLPTAGTLTLNGNGLQAIAQRPSAGSLGVELLDVAAGQSCLLTIQLAGYEQEALNFQIQIAAS